MYLQHSQFFYDFIWNERICQSQNLISYLLLLFHLGNLLILKFIYAEEQVVIGNLDIH